jgi:hypothetical protein
LFIACRIASRAKGALQCGTSTNVHSCCNCSARFVFHLRDSVTGFARSLSVRQKIFFSSLTIFLSSLRIRSSSLTTYSRTSAREWNVLRDTEGERFVHLKKPALFKENLYVEKKKINAMRSISTIETLLYVIIYPLAIELFALTKDRRAVTKRMNLRLVCDGPPEIEFGVAKKFPITIMRLPRWKR